MAETIGWLTDKILIAELKIFHTQEQIDRKDVDSSHRELCQKRLQVLQTQRDDLKQELYQLWKDVLEKKVKLKVYRQYKMYNDPRFKINKT